ncbi:MAG: GyrI-like domain-containing protein [Clostridia bacterium]
MEKIDFKKEYKDLYLPKTTPMLIQVPKMKFIIVEGQGNPNEVEGAYKQAIQILYALSFTIKMSKMGEKKIEGYYEYVVPPLEGLWWMDNYEGIDYAHKEDFKWISMIRQPEFVTKEVFDWACKEASQKKNINVEKAKFIEMEEGLCVQCMHKGSYDEEPSTIQKIENYIKKQGLENAIGKQRRHHEIYLSDPRKAKVDNLKTVIRIPVKRR